MKASLAPRAAVAGFTLLELLVAITLLGMLMAALFGGLRLGARVWETGEARLDANSRVQIVQDFLRQRIAETLPLATVLQGDDGSIEPLFRGEVDALRFATVLPEHLGSGVYLMELAIADAGEDGGRNLVLRWRPLDLSDTAPEAAVEPEERILLEGIETLDLAYFGSLDLSLPPQWWPQWQAQNAFPSLVRVDVRFAPADPRNWPELIVHPTVDLALQF